MNRETKTELPDSIQRNLIVEELDRNMLVEASAGTGKTTSMVGRMVALLRTGVCRSIHQLAAVTFTRKAAAELRARFQVKLEQAYRDSSGRQRANLKEALDGIDRCFVGTIHSFCGRMLRERPIEAGVDVAFQEIDQDVDERLRKEAWAEYSARLIADDRTGTIGELDRLGLRLADLESTFQRFADYPDVDEWPAPDEATDAPDMESTIKEILEYVDHMSDLAPQLPDEWGNDQLIFEYKRLPRIVSHYEDLSLLPNLVTVLDFFDKTRKVVQKEWMKDGVFTRDQARGEGNRWQEFRQDVVKPALRKCYEHRYGPVIRIMLEARALYDDIRKSRGLLNFQDLLMKAAALLRNNPHVRKYFRDRFTHLLVDEFQDTDPIQAEVMLLLTADDLQEIDWRNVGPRPGSLFVVGDPKQSIYRFRRADIVTYNEVKKIIAGENHDAGMVVQLSTNFRTTESIITWVNEVFQPDDDAPQDSRGPLLRFGSTDSAESPHYVRMETGRIDGNAGTLSGVYSLTIPDQLLNKDDAIEYEAGRIARTIRHALEDPSVSIPRTVQEIEQGKPPRPEASDFMVVTRNRKHLSVYARTLQEYGVPHQVTGGSVMNEVIELKMLHACLNAVLHPDDPVSLVGVLRGELFGVSDPALYAFKKAGGRFSYNSPIPEHLPVVHADAFNDAFSRLKQYSLWFAGLPAIAVIERMVADLGLMALAGIRQGGDVEAGSLAKAIEILRDIQRESWTVAQLVAHLGVLINMEETHDGISTRSEESSAVRIMNLHKVKGLEAPVVFLASPLGEWNYQVEMHVDRSGTSVKGYIAVLRESSGWTKPTLAQPPDWNAFSETEEKFLAAEALRLRYVAATRAGSAMIVTQRAKYKGRNPWQYFAKYIPEDNEIADPGPQSAPTRDQSYISADDVQIAEEAVAANLAEAFRPTHDVQGAKEYALSRPKSEPISEGGEISPEPAPTFISATAEDGEHGTEWGTVIHLLLQQKMENPEADLVRPAGTALLEHDLDADRVDEAVATVESVMRSEIWQRAQRSVQCLVEAPFQILLDETETESGLPTVLRGAIDLAFREDAGWVLVDYKTDRIPSQGPGSLASKYLPQLKLYARAWEACTGESVKEMGFFFVRAEEYVIVG
jgi:ATP-dependent helicase/nuclease subunit A